MPVVNTRKFVFLFGLLWSCVQSKLAFGKLEGSKLRCCVLEEAPYVMSDRTNPQFGNYSGLAVDYLDLIQERLKFSCSVIKKFKAQDPENQGFTGFTREMAACSKDGDSPNCTCDIGVGGWATPSIRFPLVDFVSPFSSDSYIMITRRDLVRDSSPKSIIFLEAFTPAVWLAITSLFFIVLFITLFDRNFAPAPRMQRLSPEHHTRLQRVQHFLLKAKILYRTRQAFFNTVMNMLAQSPSEIEGEEGRTRKQGTKQRAITIISILIGVFLITVFQASVTVQVLVTIPISTFQNIDDVKSCKIPANRICISKGGAAEHFWYRAIAASDHSGCLQKPRFVNSFDEGFKSVSNATCDWFYSFKSNALQAVNGKYCGALTVVGSPFFDTPVSFVLPKNSKLTETLSLETLKLREEGRLESAPNYANRRECPEVTDPTVTWDKLKVFFYVAYTTLIVLLLLIMLNPSHNESDERTENPEGDENDEISPPEEV